MATYRIEVGDGREMLRERNRRIALDYSPYVVALVAVGLWLSPHEPKWGGFFLGIGTALVLVGLAAARQFSNRYAAHCRRYREPVTVTVEPDSLRTETEHGSSILKTSALVRIQPYPESFVLEFASGVVTCLPRRHLAAHEIAILDSWTKSQQGKKGRSG